MFVNISPKFKRSYKKIPIPIQDDFDEKIKFFMNNPKNKRLRIHKLNGNLQNCLSFCLRDGYRVLFEFELKDSVNLLDIGAHDKYAKWNK